MIRLAHMTDIHISNVGATLARMWTSKRLLGGVNMMLFRRRQMRNAYLPLFVEDILSQGLHKVVVTGDLTTTALPAEFARARKLLQPLIDEDLLVTIPGNHDVYTYRSAREKRYEKHFGDCHGEPGGGGQPGDYPHVQMMGDEVVIIGVNTAIPVGFFKAYGVVDAPQLERLGTILETHKDRFRIVLMHHYLQNHRGEPGDPGHWITNRGEILETLARHGAELVLHGHKHACYNYTVDGPQHPVHVFNAGPTTWHHTEPEMQGAYHIYEIEDGELQRVFRHRFDPPSRQFQRITLWEAEA